jgi:DNA mismatch endonuclease (patch repair protein)
MPDIFTKEKRSEIMSRIRSTSGVEIRFRKLVSQHVYPLGHRYRLNYKKAVGKPDLAFVSRRVAVFLDGDFWHGKHYMKKVLPNPAKLPQKFWRDKISGNMARDRKQNRALRKLGWKVVRIWESDFKKKPDKSLQKVLDTLRG